MVQLPGVTTIHPSLLLGATLQEKALERSNTQLQTQHRELRKQCDAHADVLKAAAERVQARMKTSIAQLSDQVRVVVVVVEVRVVVVAAAAVVLWR